MNKSQGEWMKMGSILAANLELYHPHIIYSLVESGSSPQASVEEDAFGSTWIIQWRQMSRSVSK